MMKLNKLSTQLAQHMTDPNEQVWVTCSKCGTTQPIADKCKKCGTEL